MVKPGLPRFAAVNTVSINNGIEAADLERCVELVRKCESSRL